MPRGLKSWTSKSTILDFVSAAQNGSQQVLGKYCKAEEERIKESRNLDAAIKSTVRTLLGLKDKSKHLSLSE
ncbi:hypothetical protein MUCCIDRAFT_105542 [Mucor lusitanicus CBS 277.49]|uniref:Uncharacterized protein n=1 Tax=Mucor lusitanicus CBS 277.49 TaxID=747725 RepID=A0A162ZYF6_MUCCL|nr:hypothetical protein MUCCIDRAFT_105542 [Mucor lusitanicus CBS 277.49]